MAEDNKTSTQMEALLKSVTSYEREFKKWETRVEKILRRYRDEERSNDRGEGETRFNILWSNVSTLVPATFSRLPQPDVARRFNDSDPVGRVSSLVLERALEYEVTHYADYRATMRQCVHDRFLGGRGTAWARYEPHIKAAQEQLPIDGAEVTEDIDSPKEELDYECAPVDYVHWKDFGHTVARTWEEVSQVWRRVYMQMPAKIERFGEEKAKKIPKDAKPKDGRYQNQSKDGETDDGSWIYELWDKDEMCAYWFHKSMKDILDERDDPLGLEEFFPCPKPLYATLTNETLVPVPDFCLYQDQAKELDVLSDRIDGLAKMLQVKGVYDASADKSIGRLFTEGGNGNLLPVKNWSAFAEKNGLKGQVDVFDLTPIAKALEIAYKAFEQAKNQIYDITGISDIIRGVTEASETATAQQIKGQYANLRLRSMQEGVALFATQLLQLKAQIMCAKFDPQTLVKMSSAEQLAKGDQVLLQQAMELLIGPERMQDPEAQGSNPMRAFRISIAADTLVQIDEQSEKENRMEFLTAVGGALKMMAEVGMQAPQLIPLMLELLKFGVTGFKVGKTVEGMFDETVEKLKAELAQKAQQPPPPDPKVEAEKAKAQAAMKMAQMDIQKKQAEIQLDGQKMNMEMQHDQQRMAMDGQIMQQEMGMKQAAMRQDMELQQQQGQMKQHQAQAGHALKMQQMKEQAKMKPRPQ